MERPNQRWRPDSFLLGLIAMLVLAWLWPGLGRDGGPLHLDLVTRYGVAAVFLLHGLLLAPERLRAGLLNWRLHLFTQAASFVLFPLLVWGGLLVAGDGLPSEFRLGFLFLAALPTAVSTSVVVTAVAGGNVAGAIFNTALSSLLAVLLTPLWVHLFLASDGGGTLDLGAVLGRLALLVAAPLALGQLLRPWLGRLATHASGLDRLIVLLVVLNAFSSSFAAGAAAAPSPLLMAVAGADVVLFLAMIGLLSLLGRGLGLTVADRRAGMFCGAQKSIAAGAPMGAILFTGAGDLGMVLAPAILYHLLQLLIGGALARRLGTASPTEPRHPLADAASPSTLRGAGVGARRFSRRVQLARKTDYCTTKGRR